MKKYIRYFQRIISMSFQMNLAYKQDITWMILMLPIFLASELLGYYFLFLSSTSTIIAGYTFHEFLLVSSLAALIWILSSFAPISTGLVGAQIVRGDIDPYLLRPLPSWLLIWGQKIYVKKLILLLVRIILLGTIMYVGHFTFTFLQILQIGFIMFSSFILFHCLFIVADSLSFWFPNIEVNEYFFELTDQTVSYPAAIYPTWMRTICTYVLPIFLISNPIYLVLRQHYSPVDMMITLLMIILWGTAASILWSQGQRVYQSAN